MTDSSDAGAPPQPLTPRERECIVLAGEGLTAKEIGRRLGIGHRTVQNYQQEAARKLNVRGTARAAKRLRDIESVNGHPPVQLPPAPVDVAPEVAAVLPMTAPEPSETPSPAGRMLQLTPLDVMLGILAWAVGLSFCFALVTYAYQRIQT